MRPLVMALVATAICLGTATHANAQISATRRAARVQVRNSTGHHINQLVVRHRYADRYSSQAVYSNDLIWMNVADGGLTIAQRVDYRTGLVTTAADWWEVTWISDGSAADGQLVSYWTTNDTLSPAIYKDAMPGSGHLRIMVGPATTLYGWAGGWTSYWKQHILRAEDADRITTIELGANGRITYTSPSGSSPDDYWSVEGTPDRPLTMGVAAIGNRLFVAQRNQLYEVEPASNLWSRVQNVNITSAHLMTGTSEALFFIERDRLYRLDTGASMFLRALHGQSEGNWREATAMTSLGGSLYIVARNRLFKVDPATGSWTERNGQGAGGWPSTAAITSANGGLYIVTENQLYHADPNTGMWSPRNGQGRYGWPAVAAMTSLNGSLYIVTQDQLYHADPVTGNWSPRPGQSNGAWAGTEAMTALGDRLYIVQRGLLHRVDPATGRWESLGSP